MDYFKNNNEQAVIKTIERIENRIEQIEQRIFKHLKFVSIVIICAIIYLCGVISLLGVHIH